jgi:hypothetical protein
MGDLSAIATASFDVTDEQATDEQACIAVVEMELKMTSKFWKALIWTLEIPIPVIVLSIFISQLK